MMPLLFGLTAGLCNALIGLLGKQAEHTGCRPTVVPTLMLGAVALTAAIALPFIHVVWGGSGLWVLAAAMGLLYVVAVQATITANAVCPPSLVWSVTNQALLVPIMLAPALLHERWQRADALILLAFIAALWLFDKGMNQTGETAQARGMRAWLLLVVVLLSNGLLMLGYKLKSLHWPEVGAVPFVVLVFGAGALIGILTGGVARRPWATGVEGRVGLAMGLAGAGANLALLGAVTLPAVVAFPIIQGTALIGGTLLLVLRFREALNAYKIAGLCCGGLVLALAMLR